MFINCPHCKALIATDPATDLPPPRCPRCAVVLRAGDAEAATPVPVEVAADAPFGTATEEPVEEDAIEEPAGTSDNAAVEAPAQPPGLVEDAADDSAADAAVERLPAQAPPEAGAESGAAMAGVAATPSHPPAEPSAPVTAARPAKPAPSFARRRAPAPAQASRRPWLMPAAIAGLALLLALQWLLADRARLAADAGSRPLVAAACGVLGCSLPPWREPAAFTLLDRDVRPHPTRKGVLQVSASFRNDARWPQPWPEMVLTLSDVDGGEIAARGFTAAEYLGAPPSRDALESGQAAAIRMDILEPDPRAVAFAFDFR